MYSSFMFVIFGLLEIHQLNNYMYNSRSVCIMFGFACDILSGTEICKFQELFRINFILKLTKALYLSIKKFKKTITFIFIIKI